MSFSTYTIEQLEDLLSDLHTWDVMSTKLSDLVDNINIILDLVHKQTKLSTSIINKCNKIKTIIDTFGDDCNELCKLDLDDDNYDEISNIITVCLKKKYIDKLKIMMYENIDACKYMTAHVDNYFAWHDIKQREEGRLADIMQWIIRGQNIENELEYE